MADIARKAGEAEVAQAAATATQAAEGSKADIVKKNRRMRRSSSTAGVRVRHSCGAVQLLRSASAVVAQHCRQRSAVATRLERSCGAAAHSCSAVQLPRSCSAALQV